MDIYDYLKMDHQKVDQLFKLFEHSKIEQRKKDIMLMIHKELIVHAHAEQETFYKTVEDYPETLELAHHGEKEHREIEAQLKKIIESNHNQWHEAVISLKELVTHHVKEEESEIFNKAKKVLSQETAFLLKEKMHFLKGIFLNWLMKKENEPI
ncbi:hemerythrin domain-containing protein [Legionella rowbothamii]|uniref:hemerythrin domain-containing protein n=1 Tax=Legionella rowbothamii TaxID=96229 RepID=UPI0010555BC8|nr:hemerythrin domain-containing protein [Legionella rowbothamii]